MDINGCVEYFEFGEWHHIIVIDRLFLKHSDMNACFFGVDNYGGFEPLFPERGVPDDCDQTTKNHLEGPGTYYHTWAIWSEFLAIDWDEKAPNRDERISEYLITNDGKEEFQTKFLNWINTDDLRKQLDANPEAEVRQGNHVYRRNILTRRDALFGTEFPLLMKLMECLAERFGNDNVRLVVCFG